MFFNSEKGVDLMSRRNIGTALDRENLNNHNDNYEELYNQFNDVAGKITDDVYEEIRNDVKLNWREPVDTLDDLPDNAETGDTRMVRESVEGVSPVYRYNGSEWIEIQGIDATAITEVDERLQAEIDKKETPEGAQEKADTAEANAKEEIDKLEKDIMDDDGEVVKVVESGSNEAGSYTRWSDGRQECWMEKSQTANISEGNIYKSSNDTVKFPKNFDDSYDIFIAARVRSVNRWANAIATNASDTSVIQFSSKSSGSSSFKTQLYAVGRWK